MTGNSRGLQSAICSPQFLLLVVFVGLGVTYALVTPCFEGPDEWSHLSLVRYLVAHRALPPRALPTHPARTGADVAWYFEYHDPPLYYAPPLYHGLAALLISLSPSPWTDMGDLPYLLVPSPSWEAGWPPQADTDPWNKNIYAHRAEETWTQSGTVRATYLLRLASLGLGAVTVLCAYALARLLWPDEPVLALTGAAFVAFNPQFIAISASVTNDNLLNALFSLSLVCALRYVRDGPTWDRWALLGGLVGLGLLTKQSALLLLPLGSLAVVWQRGGSFLSLFSPGEARGQRWRKVLADHAAFLGVALGLGGWWYARNAILYGDPLGLEPHFASQLPLTRFGLREAADALRASWAAFGWAPLLVELPVYTVTGLVMLVALAGIIVAILPGGSLWRAPAMTRRGLALLASAFALNAVSFVRWAMATGVLSGRLLFPTLPVVGVLSAWGFSQWRRWAVFRWGLGVIAGLAFLFAAIVPWRYLRPAYESPRLPAGMPHAAQLVGAMFQGGVQLAGYDEIAGDLEPGGQVGLTLYWHAPRAPNRRYRVWVQLAPQDPTRKVAGYDTWLGGTLYPSELWKVGDTVRQTYRLAVPTWAPAPGLYWVRAGLVDDAGTRVKLTDGGGDMVVLGPWRMIAISAPPSPTCVTDFRLGSAISLVGYDVQRRQDAGKEVLQVMLYWQAEQAPGAMEMADFTVYVHLVDGEGHLLGQHDGPPRDGAYPTSWWLPDQAVVDQHIIRLDEPTPPSAQLRVGMYDPATLVRLPAYDGTGQRLPDDTISLTIPGLP